MGVLVGDPRPAVPSPPIELPSFPYNVYHVNEDWTNTCPPSPTPCTLALEWTKVLQPSVCCVSEQRARQLAGGDPVEVFESERIKITRLFDEMEDRMPILQQVWDRHATSIARSDNVRDLQRLFERIVAVYTMVDYTVAFVLGLDRYDVAVVTGGTGISTVLPVLHFPVTEKGEPHYLRHYMKYAFMVTIKDWYTAMCSTVPRFDMTGACRALKRGSYTIIGSGLSQGQLSSWGVAMLAAFATLHVMQERGYDTYVGDLVNTSNVTIAMLLAALFKFISYMGHNAVTSASTMVVVNSVIHGMVHVVKQHAVLKDGLLSMSSTALLTFMNAFGPKAVAISSGADRLLQWDLSVADMRRTATEVSGGYLTVGTTMAFAALASAQHLPPMSDHAVYRRVSSTMMNYAWMAAALAHVQSASFMIEGVSVTAFSTQVMQYLSADTAETVAKAVIERYFFNVDKATQQLYVMLLTSVMVFYMVIHGIFTSENIAQAADIAAEAARYNTLSNAMTFLETNQWAFLPRLHTDVADLHCMDNEDEHDACDHAIDERDDVFRMAKWVASLVE